jgi:hypothetical protein
MGYQQPPMQPPKKNNRLALAILGVLAIVVIAGIAYAALTRDSSKGSVSALAVGDCVDRPTDPEAEIFEMQHQPCNTPHDGEVFALVTNPAGPDEPYPVVSGFEDYVVQACTPAWESYTGRSWATDTELSMAWLEPTLSGWTNDNDRSFTCYVIRVDRAKLNASVKGIGASPLP